MRYRKGTPKNFCDKDFAELLGELSGAICLKHEQLVDVHRKLGILENEATRLQQAEIGGLKERCRKIEQESVRTDRKWQSVHEQLQKIPELERELRASNQKIANLERKTLVLIGNDR